MSKKALNLGIAGEGGWGGGWGGTGSDPWQDLLVISTLMEFVLRAFGHANIL